MRHPLFLLIDMLASRSEACIRDDKAVSQNAHVVSDWSGLGARRAFLGTVLVATCKCSRCGGTVQRYSESASGKEKSK